MNLRSDIKLAIEKAANKLWPDLKIEVELGSSAQKSFGDYSTPAALLIAKKIKAKPLEIAEQLKESIGEIALIKEITVTPPGFINFALDYAALAQKVLSQSTDIGSGKNQSQVALEHTSVNPNKAAHIGHLRNAVLGDSLARILRRQGLRVEVQNYIDDLGLQVAESVLAFERSGLKNLDEISEPIDVWMWREYAKINQAVQSDYSLKSRRDEILHEMEEGSHVGAKDLVDRIVAAHREIFAEFDINYDLLVYEHDIIANNLWQELFEELQEKKLIYKGEEGEYSGAWLVPFGEEEREHKILVRSNGLPTYTAKDLAYELWKFGKTPEMKGYETRLKPIDRTITLIDERQTYPREVIHETMEKLGYQKEADNYHHLSYGVVKLSSDAMKQLGQATSEDKATYSMSGRSGIGVMVRDVLNTAKKIQIEKFSSDEVTAHQIAVGSIRYYMLKTRPLREIVFDFNEAFKTDGNTGVYLQYAYARANNILVKAGCSSLPTSIPEMNPHEISLVKNLSELEFRLGEAQEALDPSLLCDFTYELANSFAKFYETSPVASAEGELKDFRIVLVQKYLEVMGILLETLGIPALKKI